MACDDGQDRGVKRDEMDEIERELCPVDKALVAEMYSGQKQERAIAAMAAELGERAHRANGSQIKHERYGFQKYWPGMSGQVRREPGGLQVALRLADNRLPRMEERDAAAGMHAQLHIGRMRAAQQVLPPDNGSGGIWNRGDGQPYGAERFAVVIQDQEDKPAEEHQSVRVGHAGQRHAGICKEYCPSRMPFAQGEIAAVGAESQGCDHRLIPSKRAGDQDVVIERSQRYRKQRDPYG